jgi:hypothetical protein
MAKVRAPVANSSAANASSARRAALAALSTAAAAAAPWSLRARFLTPYNRLVGALMVRQTRLQKPFAGAGAAGPKDVCGFRGDSFGRYSETADPGRGLLCLAGGEDASPYGIDPVFAPFSGLYDGKIDVSR